MSLRKAVNAKCRECTYDPLDVGSSAQQIACCVASQCPLHPVRPVSTRIIPLSLLEAYKVSFEQLDDRARALVDLGGITAGEGQNGQPLAPECTSEPRS